MSTFFSHAEVTDLCGYSQPARQARWLADHGYRFERRRDGTIALLRAAVEAKIGYATEKKGPGSPRLRLPQARQPLAGPAQ